LHVEDVRKDCLIAFTVEKNLLQLLALQ